MPPLVEVWEKSLGGQAEPGGGRNAPQPLKVYRYYLEDSWNYLLAPSVGMAKRFAYYKHHKQSFVEEVRFEVVNKDTLWEQERKFIEYNKRLEEAKI